VVHEFTPVDVKNIRAQVGIKMSLHLHLV